MNEEQLEQLIPYRNGATGAYIDRIDNRDQIYDEQVFGAVQVDFNQGYSTESKLGHVFEIENQGISLSCVGQAWQKYTEVLNYVEEKVEVNLSPKYVYSQIYLPQGGAMIRDGAKIVVNQGVSTEDLLPSYHKVILGDGTVVFNPMNEDEYRKSQDITEGARIEAKIYQSKEYRSIVDNSIDTVAVAILQNWGCVMGAIGTNQGWRMPQGKVRPPLPGETIWGHAFYACGFGRDERGRFIEFINSWSKAWGVEGKGRLYEDYFQSGNVFSPWTLVDKPNQLDDMIETIRIENDERIWAKSTKDNSIYHIGGFETYQEGLRNGWFKEVKTVLNLSEYVKKNSFGFIK